MPLIESAPDALARLYATALFDLAKESGGQEAIETCLAELEELLELARADATFNEFLSSRILPAKTRADSLTKILDGSVSDLTKRFLLVLNSKDRLGNLAPIAAAFDQLVQEAFGRIEVDVYTAAPIDADELNAIRERLQSILGKQPVVHPYVDNAMIGGLKLQIGDQLIDASVATRLRRLRDKLGTEGSAQVRAAADRLVGE